MSYKCILDYNLLVTQGYITVIPPIEPNNNLDWLYSDSLKAEFGTFVVEYKLWAGNHKLSAKLTLIRLIIGIVGFNGALRVRSVDSYDPKKDEWRPVASMEARRSTLGAAVLNGLLYAVGGFDGTTGLSTCEVRSYWSGMII